MKPELKARIEEAAALSGLNLTDFVLSTLSERASQVVERHQNITLSDRDRDRFLDALGRAGRPIPELVDTIQKHRTLRTDSTINTAAASDALDD